MACESNFGDPVLVKSLPGGGIEVTCRVCGASRRFADQR